MMVDMIRIVRPIAGPLEDARVSACPLADIREPSGWVSRVMAVAVKVESGASLSQVVERPTAVVTEALAVLANERAHVAAAQGRGR